MKDWQMLNQLFVNTLDRHGNECWTDVSDFALAAGTGSAFCLALT